VSGLPYSSPAKAGAQLGNEQLVSATPRYADLPNWAPPFAVELEGKKA
jgi:hypothetical protein